MYSECATMLPSSRSSTPSEIQVRPDTCSTTNSANLLTTTSGYFTVIPTTNSLQEKLSGDVLVSWIIAGGIGTVFLIIILILAVSLVVICRMKKPVAAHTAKTRKGKIF